VKPDGPARIGSVRISVERRNRNHPAISGRHRLGIKTGIGPEPHHQRSQRLQTIARDQHRAQPEPALLATARHAPRRAGCSTPTTTRRSFPAVSRSASPINPRPASQQFQGQHPSSIGTSIPAVLGPASQQFRGQHPSNFGTSISPTSRPASPALSRPAFPSTSRPTSPRFRNRHPASSTTAFPVI
jgi:hypothetical protein